MSEYKTFTHRFNINDVSLLLEEAKNIESYDKLRERSAEVLGQPSRARRKAIAGDVKRFLLDYGEKNLNPSKLSLVRLWNAVQDPKARREFLYIDFMNHVKIMDAFVKEILYNKVSKPSDNLFRTEHIEIQREEVDNFLGSNLEKYTPSTFQKTRNHLLGMLGEFGILRGKGSDFSSEWTVRHYEPTLIGWLYGIYREFDHISERKRSETYFMDESSTTRRFLLSSGELRYLIRKALEESYLDREIFGGVPVYRLPQPDTDTFVERFINGQR